MRVSGYGEFQQMRKLVSKEDAQTHDSKKANDNEESTSLLSSNDDVVQISSEARLKIKMRRAADFRDAKVQDVRERLEAGTLVTPEALKNGTTKMLNSLITGEL